MATSGGSITINPASSGNGVTDRSATLTIGGQQFSLSAGTLTTNNTAYGLTVGATTLSGNPTFYVANNGTGVGTLTLGALNDGGTAFTITKAGSGVLTLSASATSLIAGTTFNVTGGTLASTVAGGLSTATVADATTVNLTGGELKGTVAGASRAAAAAVQPGDQPRGRHAPPGQHSAATNFGGDVTYSSGSLVLDRTISGAANTDTMGALSIGAVTLQPITTNYTSAPTVVFGATTLTGNAIFDATYANITLGAVGDGGVGCTITAARGAGTLTLSASNTYGGGTTLSAGQLNFNNSSAIGTGPFTINGGTLDNTSGGTLTNLNNNPQNWNASFAFLGSNNLNLGTGTVRSTTIAR